MIKDKLQIFIVTYNRKNYLERTLCQILAQTSPIKDYDITILDNNSTDGTSELIQKYCKKFLNLTHVRHNFNIGGNANIVRAFEIGASCKKEYCWVLCDDDKFDFSNWKEVESNVEKGKDIICVCNYAIEYKKNKEIHNAQKLLQLTFVPAGIYKRDLFDDNLITNMHNSIYAYFPHVCISIHAINNNKEISILSSPIVFNGLYCEDECKATSYTRGLKKAEILQRTKDTSWVLGFSNILTLLQDKKLQQEAMQNAIIFQDIYGCWNNFYYCMYEKYLKTNKINYLFEIFKLLNFSKTLKFILYSIYWTITLKALRCKMETIIYLRKKRKHLIAKEDREYWIKYFEKINLQKHINEIAKKNKNKKILLYGNGIISKVIQENYDLSGLNIIGIADRKFLGCDAKSNQNFNIIKPNEIDMIDCDVILIAVKQFKLIKNILKNNCNKKTTISIIK